ncbi:hypothetical protein ADU80_09520 [Clostridium botulinum]|uniref:Uncharacterized protein n=1 Tax=Clostridium botulinum TaxID=1491 RepID=A0A9Q1ZC03_CLOBO|nr:hypothetical protein [Clostridium botulinum]AEB74978.1 hypothetical protein CbC4_0298 [Clostridium botulinum BKT015925]KEI02251.1 hypothetical protein Y848_07880 [Clostridium botulinum C/D str. Sp77]KEI03636.1 hypothetical protein Z953_04030 [Clostridium botulinum D str. 16868]KOA78874.1 hypothetical protein ADU77_05165 [Clostridium botulinum]KOA81764.1 hypothetical protein ADU74_14035 [Clostridium botulinum]
MRVIFDEIKKIFNPKMVFLLIIINILMYFMFIEFSIKYFPNGRPEGDIFRVVTEMRKKYGTHIDNKEFQDFKNIYNEKLKEVNKYIKENKEFKKCNINTYDEFLDQYDKYVLSDDKEGEEFRKLHSKIVFDEGVDLFWEIPERQRIIEDYENKNKNIYRGYVDLNLKRKDRIKEILSSGDETSVFHDMIISNYNELMRYGSIIILLSTVFMISPVFIKDKKNKINYLQYTCKGGRGIFKKKIVAGIIASFIITTAQLTCFFIIYSHNNTYKFLDCSINSIFSSTLFWYDLSFRKYIVITVIAIYMLVLAFSLIAMMISSLVKNYIGLVGFQVPIVIYTFIFILDKIIMNIFSIRDSKYFFEMWYLCIFLIPIILIVIVWRKEKVLDIV